MSRNGFQNVTRHRLANFKVSTPSASSGKELYLSIAQHNNSIPIYLRGMEFRWGQARPRSQTLKEGMGSMAESASKPSTCVRWCLSLASVRSSQSSIAILLTTHGRRLSLLSSIEIFFSNVNCRSVKSPESQTKGQFNNSFQSRLHKHYYPLRDIVPIQFGVRKKELKTSAGVQFRDEFLNFRLGF